MALKDFGGDARYAAKQALLGPNAGADMSLADMWNALQVPYQLYDDPGLYRSDDGIVSPYAFSGNQIPVYDGQQFKLVQGGNTLYEGTGYDALKQAAELSKNLGSGWSIYGTAPDADPDSTAVNPLFAQGTAGVGYAGKSKSDFDPKFLIGALPMLAAVAAPAIGAALGGGGGTLGAGATAAAGGGLGGAAATGAAGIGSAIANAAALAPALVGGVAPITVLGATGAGLGAGALGALGAGAAGAAGALASGSAAGNAAVNPITVTGAPGVPIDLSSLAGLDFGGLAGIEALGAVGNPPPTTTGTEDIVVEGQQQPPPLDLLSGISPIDLASLGAAATIPLTASPPITASNTAPSTTDKIISALKAAGLLTGVLGGALGGGGGGNGKIPGGIGQSLNPIFDADLPAPNIPGVGSPENLAARTMPAQDWTRYAMRPEQSFFKYVPQGYAPPASGTLDPQWDKEHNFARGGRASFAVRGAGTGRSDSIKANLSDGEYVMDAETVALLGDGSNQAGAKALDTFRANIRKQKGRQFAKGQFSVKAKKPEKYLGGRK